ncbi:DUF2934 domain-containing protein [Methylobacterium sp. J-090]|uniref:DUF2934 domain-containing protein n=1 Tax=Methylobacterium sp. J-090 TaxID=2836666 RepID=UPI001FBB6857|nr:DUF2934 domain-containing protein [Methylobacterium sp. J-090]MCJ2082200.1 DUF2934 domain-containing protein [Methylobacterium sp. J-090]
MHPFEQQVRERAYFIWEGEGRVFGHATEHWLRAERELAADAPVQVRPVVAEISLAPSPARALKPKAGARSAAAKAVAETAEAAKPTKAAAAKPTKATATKAATAKVATTKSASTKAAPTKATTAKAPSARTAASRSKAFEAGVVMH